MESTLENTLENTLDNTLEDPVIRKAYTIFANYLLRDANGLLQEELDYAVNNLLELPITQADLPLLEKIFMEEISLVCRHIFLSNPYSYDGWCDDFEEEFICEKILYFQQHCIFRYLVRISFFCFRAKGEYYDSWKRLKGGLILRWNHGR